MKHLFAWLHAQTVHRKLLLIILATSTVSMLVAGGALFAYLTFAQRQSFERDATALAEIIAVNCAGSVAFADRSAAMGIMLSLKAKEQIVGAAIWLPNGESLVRIGRAGPGKQAVKLEPGGEWKNGTYFVQTSPIFVRGEQIGTLQMISDFEPVYAQFFRSYVLVFVLTFAGALYIGFMLTQRARRVISDPIQNLADSVRVMSENPGHAKSPVRVAGGEVGEIADAFHLMANRVKAGAQLEKEVAERRRVELALRESEERFRSLFDNAPVGLYRATTDGRFLMANRAMLNLLAYPSFEELAQVDIMNHVCVIPNYRNNFRECLEHIGMVEETEVQWRRLDGKVIYVRESAKVVRDAAGKMIYYEGCVEDITARKEAAAELQRLHRELVDTSRAAGMAEVATGVLHNVGNVLNSVGVSAQLLRDQLSRSRFTSLQQGVALMQANGPQLGSFLTDDPKGRLLPGFLAKVTQHVAGEHERWLAELRQLQANIEHMKEVVAMQQDYARVSDVSEPLVAAELLEDALRMNLAAFDRHHIQVQRDYADVPLVMVDKHKVLQILINLIRNAKYALDDGGSPEKQLKLKIYKNGSGRVKIVVADNGQGIPKENLTRIFQHGFTTRRDGHGFGLHSGAIAAKELGGELVVQSDGPGLGATFTLELPVAGGNN